MPRGGLMLGKPSVKSMMCCMRPPSDLVFNSSTPFFKPSQRFVHPAGSRLSRSLLAASFPLSDISVRLTTVEATSEYAITARRSWSVKLWIMVWIACFTTSNTERPLLSTPSSPFSTACVPMEPDVSTTQQKSHGVRALPSGGVSSTITGTSKVSLEASASSPGTVLALTRNSFGVAIGGGGIPIALLRREGMDAASALG
mmetsp:Transcript_51093/g.143612  ORF Transcript_51093/g.143612 Transcript_51093/m.143612 type:complete len:200 (+) Transcript_51093:1621-2220(+)